MSSLPPGGAPRPFTSTELDGASGATPEDLVGATRVARELEALAARTPVRTTPDFADRVMGAIAAEPVPAPVRTAGRALRMGSLGAFLASIRDAWRVTTSPGFPMAARAQALALVLVVAALAAGSGMATAGALGLFGDSDASLSPIVQPTPPPSEVRTEPPSTSPEASEDVSQSPEPRVSAEPAESPGDTAEPGETAEPDGTDGTDHGGSDGEDATATPKSGDKATPRPTETPEPDGTDGQQSTPKPGDTPKPSETPHTD